MPRYPSPFFMFCAHTPATLVVCLFSHFSGCTYSGRRTATHLHNAADDLRSINYDVTSISGMAKLYFINLVDTLD